MDALRTDDLTSPLGPFLLASLAIHLLLVFLLPVAAIDVPERPVPATLVPPAESASPAAGARGLLVPLGSLRMQVIELEVPPALAAVPPPAVPSEIEIVAPRAPVSEPVVPETPAGAVEGVAQGPAPGGGAGAGAGGGGEGGDGTGAGAGDGTGAGPGIVEPPVIVAMVWPAYPKAARKELKIPIVLAVHVTAEGHVDEVEVETPSGCPSCEAAAIESAWQLRFQPATRDGVPIPMWTRFPVVFGQR